VRHLSHGRRTPPSGHPDPLWPAAPAEDAEPDAELPHAELHEVLLAGLAELPARQRELLLLLVEDPTLSCDQISRRTGIPVDGTGPTRGRALERLWQTLAVSDHLADQARAPAPPDGAARFGGGTPRDLDRPRGRLSA
jgi:DNA-directed RNA polymerase specialized sigma24 family protein